MRVAVMQPYFLPYLGYFKLMHEVDVFILFDNVQMSRRSWISRNRFSPNREPSYNHSSEGLPITFSLPISKSARESLILDQHHSADHYFIYKSKRRFNHWYPNSDENFLKLSNDIFDALEESTILVNVLKMQLRTLSTYLRIQQPHIVRASDILLRKVGRNHAKESPQDYIVRVCQKLGATSYLNLPGGKSLYSHSFFRDNGISLKYIQFSKSIESTPMLSAMHYSSFSQTSGLDLINKFWFVDNG